MVKYVMENKMNNGGGGNKYHYDDNRPHNEFIRGVNIGGWLMAERFITPYLFAINSCHLEGDLCWYPGQIGAPLNATVCDPEICEPVRPVYTKDGNHDYHPRNARWYYDYPQDEYTLGMALNAANRGIAHRYMERHWDTFVTMNDLKQLRQAGVTHLRVPMGYWIRGDIRPGEPWIDGGWPYFVRFVDWCRTVGLLVIADLHGAPGSENGFDNSGQLLVEKSTCVGWSDSPENVARTLDIVEDITMAIAEGNMTDIVTGFGLLNEPFLDCDDDVLRQYYDDAREIVRRNLGETTLIVIGDKFNAGKFNDGFWIDSSRKHSLLDTHPYHIFFEQGRAMTPKQHIAYVCRYNDREVNSCCYEDHPANTIPSQGVSRIVGEWSAAYDILPTALTPAMMKIIARDGIAPYLDRELSTERKQFMINFVKAQMVTYEAMSTGVSQGWLFWNFKMEGGAFAEWDFLRGIDEKWIPTIPDPTVSSFSLYGSCYDIINQTSDDYSAIVQEYPDPRILDWNQYQGWSIDDDYVLQIGGGIRTYHRNWNFATTILPIVVTLFSIMFLLRLWKNWTKQKEYVQLK